MCLRVGFQINTNTEYAAQFMQRYWLLVISHRPFDGLSKGYPPHDTGVDEGEAKISHKGNRPVETLWKDDESQIL